MSRRADRRDRIIGAFDELRTAVASALGAAIAHRERAVREHARAMFEYWMRVDGLPPDLETDPVLRRGLGNTVLTDTVQRIQRDRTAAFEPWVSSEPEVLADLVAAAAGGAAGEHPDRWLGQPGKADGAPPVPQLWRIGTAVAGGVAGGAPPHEPFPVAVPLLDESHLQITTTHDSRTAAESLVETLLMRVVSYFRPGMVAVHVWDVGQFTGAMPGLYPLTRCGLLTVHDSKRLSDLLEELSDHIRRVHTRVLVDGQPSLAALADAAGGRSEPWRLAVLVGNRAALREEDLRQLQRVARNGLACGIQLVLVDLPVTLSAPVETIKLTDGGSGSAVCSMSGPHATVTLDPPLPREQVSRACHAICDDYERWRSRVGSFGDLLPVEPWLTRSTAGVRAPVGFADGLTVELALCDASPHALVGGPSGSGKTNLLLTLIGSLAARYSPDELELYLLDFKEGVSFAQFTPGRKDQTWLPHARLVGVNINTDREFGLALLQFLSEEMRRRAEAAKEHEVTKLEELRVADEHGRWPRIVAVIDEFQYLFAERDSVTRQAVTLLEDVARRGRSQGIHLVLCSQDVSGIEAFWGRPAIFEQFVLRVALPRARRVLADLNDATLDLPRWHAVLNHESGIRHGNEIARIPDATAPDTIDALQKQLWERRPAGLAEPRLFDGGRRPPLSELMDGAGLAPGTDPPAALLGQVIDVAGSAAGVRMPATPGRNLAVISSGTDDAARVLGAAALSLASQHEPGTATFTIGVPVAEAAAPAGALVESLRQDGHLVDQVGLDGVADRLVELAEEVGTRLTGQARSPHYVVLYAVDAAEAALERAGQEALRQLLHRGPETGVHVLGWWRSVQRLKNTLSTGAAPDDVGCWVAFDIQGQELGALAPGQLIAWSPRPGRGLLFDRSAHARPEVLIVPEIDRVTRVSLGSLEER